MYSVVPTNLQGPLSLLVILHTATPAPTALHLLEQDVEGAVNVIDLTAYTASGGERADSLYLSLINILSDKNAHNVSMVKDLTIYLRRKPSRKCTRLSCLFYDNKISTLLKLIIFLPRTFILGFVALCLC